MTSGRFPWAATIAVTAAFAILCGLGVWQVKRLAWKAHILYDLNRAYGMDPPPVLNSDDFLKAESEGDLFLNGRISGHFLPQWQFTVAPRTHDGKNGAHVYAPFRLDDGGTILVNRGWAPEGWKEPVSENHIVLEGLARQPDRINLFVPPNRPDQGLWYSIRLPEIVRHTGIRNLAPYVFYAGSADGGYPIGMDQNWQPDNNHLQYAIFWFTMAGLLLLIYGLRFIQPYLKAKKIAQPPPIIH